MQQQPVQQIVQLLQIVAQQQQQLVQISQVQQHQLQYLQQIVQSLPAQVLQLQQFAPQYAQQQPFGQAGAGFPGISPWTTSPFSGVQANYVM